MAYFEAENNFFRPNNCRDYFKADISTENVDYFKDEN